MKAKHDCSEAISPKAAEYMDATRKGRKLSDFRPWVAKSPDRIGEVLRAVSIPALLKEVDAVKRFDREALIQQARAFEDARRFQSGVRLAASILLLLVAGLFFHSRFQPTEAPQIVEYSTVGKAPRTIELPDHSTVMLDAESVMTVHFEKSSRDVRLAQGKADFDVKHLDGNVPFTVHTRYVVVNVVGTQFSVETAAGHSRVDVAIGTVRVSGVSMNSEVRTLKDKQSIVAREEGFVVDEPVVAAAPVPKQAVLRATDLTITPGRTLEEIAAVFNRASGKERFVIDADARSQKLWATLSVNDPDQFIQVLRRQPALSVTGTHESDHVIVRMKRTASQ